MSYKDLQFIKDTLEVCSNDLRKGCPLNTHFAIDNSKDIIDKLIEEDKKKSSELEEVSEVVKGIGLSFKFTQGSKMIITTDQWFYAQDGHQYHSIWGRCFVYKAEELFGFSPKRSADWYLVIRGSEGITIEPVIIAGCQIHYAAKCEHCPPGNEIYKLR